MEKKLGRNFFIFVLKMRKNYKGTEMLKFIIISLENLTLKVLN